jgi:hypothetical protein
VKQYDVFSSKDRFPLTFYLSGFSFQVANSNKYLTQFKLNSNKYLTAKKLLEGYSIDKEPMVSHATVNDGLGLLDVQKNRHVI